MVILGHRDARGHTATSLPGYHHTHKQRQQLSKFYKIHVPIQEKTSIHNNLVIPNSGSCTVPVSDNLAIAYAGSPSFSSPQFNHSPLESSSSGSSKSSG